MPLIPIENFVGPTAAQRYNDVNSERTINFYVGTKFGAENPKSDKVLIGTPGINPYVNYGHAEWGTGVFTSCTTNFNGFGGERTFFITGETPNAASGGNCHLVEITGAGSWQDRGALYPGFTASYVPWKMVPTSTGLFCIGNGGAVFYNANGGGLTTLYNPSGGSPGTNNFPGCSDACFSDGYTILTGVNSNKWYISAYQDPTQYDPLDFNLMNDTGDSLIACASWRRLVFIWGLRRMECFQNSGNADFPFTRINQMSSRIGCTNPGTVQVIGDHGIIWVGRGTGSPGVYMTNGGLPQKISSPNIDSLISSAIFAGQLDAVKATSFAWEGYAFYALTIPVADITLLYNLTTNTWTQWSYGGTPTTGFPKHTITTMSYNKVFGKLLVGTRDFNQIFSLELRGDDNGALIHRVRCLPTMNGNGRRAFYSKFILDATPNANIDLQWNDTFSDVGPFPGQPSYSPYPYRPNPGANMPGNRIGWTRLGSAYNQRLWQVFVSDGTVSPTIINSAFVEVK